VLRRGEGEPSARWLRYCLSPLKFEAKELPGMDDREVTILILLV
jgi:hypothetical protein